MCWLVFETQIQCADWCLKHKTNALNAVWNDLRVNIKDTRTTLLLFNWCYFVVFIVLFVHMQYNSFYNFEHVRVRIKEQEMLIFGKCCVRAK